MNDIRQVPCPGCGANLAIDSHDERPGLIWPCHTCQRHLVLTDAGALAIATNADLEKRPIGEQEVGRLFQQRWSGIPRDVHC
jgi:hypothetical protein